MFSAKYCLSGPINDVRPNFFCASLLRTKTPMPRLTRGRALRNNKNNDRADGHCRSFAWIQLSWTFGDPYFFFQNQILFTIISRSQKINKKSMREVKKNFTISVHRKSNSAMRLLYISNCRNCSSVGCLKCVRVPEGGKDLSPSPRVPEGGKDLSPSPRVPREERT